MRIKEQETRLTLQEHDDDDDDDDDDDKFTNINNYAPNRVLKIQIIYIYIYIYIYSHTLTQRYALHAYAPAVSPYFFLV